jgi:TRAP-type C4-dicarboxylate transport system permease small subunit
MDWIGVIAFIAGIILILIGVGLALNLPAVMQFVEEILGILCIILGIIAAIFGVKLIKSV